MKKEILATSSWKVGTCADLVGSGANLTDVTMRNEYSSFLGYTREELEVLFSSSYSRSCRV
ncbi:MAG: hypothetical protein ACHQUC_06910 [Chlamydiales bacterium]